MFVDENEFAYFNGFLVRLHLASYKLTIEMNKEQASSEHCDRVTKHKSSINF